MAHWKLIKEHKSGVTKDGKAYDFDALYIENENGQSFAIKPVRKEATDYLLFIAEQKKA